MADAAAARYEDHRGRNVTADHHGVVSRAARDAARGRALRRGGTFDDVDELRIELEWLEREDLLQLGFQGLFPCDPSHGFLDDLLQLRDTFRGGGANVDREIREPGNDVGAAGGDRDLADVRGHVRPRACLLAQFERDPCRTGERVAPQAHRRRAGMVRLPAQPYAVAAKPDDRGDDPDLNPFGLEHRALLDVQLQVSADLSDAASLGYAVELVAALVHSVPQRHARSVDARTEASDILAGERAAAEERRIEARALLVHERHDPDGTPRLEDLFPQQAAGVQPGDDAEDAVEPSAGRHRVQVRADQDGTADAGLPAPDQVACGVDLDLETDCAHAVAHPLVRGEELRRPRHPRHPAVASGPDPPKLLEARSHRAGQRGLVASVRGGRHLRRLSVVRSDVEAHTITEPRELRMLERPA